jgi:hypothetical protein
MLTQPLQVLLRPKSGDREGSLTDISAKDPRVSNASIDVLDFGTVKRHVSDTVNAQDEV